MGDGYDYEAAREDRKANWTPFEHFTSHVQNARARIKAWTSNVKEFKKRWRAIDEVTDETTFKQAAELLKDIKKAKTAVKSYYAPWKRELNDAREIIITMEKVDTETLDTLHESVDSSMKAWEDARKEEERLAREEAEAAARRKAEAERLGQIEALRIAKEKQASEAVKNAIETELKTLKNTPVTPAKVSVPSFVPPVQGFWRTETHEASVDDFNELILAVADAIRDPTKPGPPPEALLPNMVHLNAQARTLTDNMSKAYPGVSAKKKSGSAAR
jgi:hypothetical protein